MQKRLRVLPSLVLLFFLLLAHSPALAEANQEATGKTGATYPQLDVSGFKKWEYKKADVDPQKNYFNGLTYLGGFQPNYTGGPWQERLQLKILGQLSENLSVTYDLEQQPEVPDKYDVRVKYYNNELVFGDFNANFAGNEFASSSRFLNGVMLSAKDTWYDVLTVPSAKVKSQTQSLTIQKGNNTRGPFSLGHGSIIEGTELVYLNNVVQKRNTDYTIDYFEGKITFTKIITPADEFKYSYEYTNILDLFFPALSKRDFFGFQSRFTIDPEQFGRKAPKPEPIKESTREVFPTAISTVEDESIGEEEAAGRYQLKLLPIVEFSENLTFMGTTLKRNEDYIIRYDEGAIKLLTRFLPSSAETLVVDYRYFQTSGEAETVSGIGSRGPYKLSRQNITPNSEQIVVDGKVFIRDLDYKIDYKKSEITFGMVLGPTSAIQASYRYQIMVAPPQPVSKFPKQLVVGGTYLKESAKRGASSPTATVVEASTGQKVIQNNGLLYLSNFPLNSTAEVVVRVNGVVISWEVDYVIPSIEVDSSTGFTRVIPDTKLAYVTDRSDRSNGLYTGTIKIIMPLAATDEISAVYTYQKSTVGKYSAAGDGTRGPYYLRNIRNLVPGSETVQVWDQGSSTTVTYTRNSSFEANAGDTGYSINYTADNPSIYFNKELGPTKNFQILYKYVPPTGYEGGDIAHEITGFDASFKIGEVLKIEGSTANSKIDQSYTATPTRESRAGNGTKIYTLSSAYDLIEGSEKVYVNGYLRNKDIDYFINYSRPGALTFFYITPATSDTIIIDYEFKAPLDVAGEVRKKEDRAFKLGASSKLLGDKITLSANLKDVGHDFTPMGGTSVGLGSKYRDFDFGFKPNFHSFALNYSYKQNDNPIATYRNQFLRTYDYSIASSITPREMIKFDLGYRRYNTEDDLLPGAALHNSDALQESFSLGATPSEWKRGLLTVTQQYDVKRTLSETDNLDKLSPEKSRLDFLHGGANLKLTDRLSGNLDWQFSQPVITKMLTTSDGAGNLSTAEAEFSRSRSTDISYGVALDLTVGPLKAWTARASFVDHEEKTLRSNYTALDRTTTTKNETYRVDLSPIAALATSLDHNRQERTAVTASAENPKTVRTSGTAKLTPHPTTALSWNGSESNAVQETGAKTSGKSNAYGLEYNPISLERLKVGSKFNLSNGTQTAPSGSYEVTTNTDSLVQDYTLNVILHRIIPITFGYNQEEYKNLNNSLTTPLSTETRNRTFKIDLQFVPLAFLTFDGNYNLKLTENVRTGENRPKEVNEGKVTYQTAGFGTVAYGVQEEKNRGEIQAGAVADYDFKKTTQNISLNLTFPQDNPILSSVVFLISWKNVGYENYKNRGDDFKASLMSFEGTLNF